MNYLSKRKTFIFTFIIIIVLGIILSGVFIYLHINREQPNVFISPEYTQYTSDTDFATFIWNNKSDKIITYGPDDWYIEKWNVIYWRKVICEPWFNWLTLKGVQVNSSSEQEYNIGWFRNHSAYGALKPGKYRLISNYSSNGNLPVKYRVTASFEITK